METGRHRIPLFCGAIPRVNFEPEFSYGEHRTSVSCAVTRVSLVPELFVE